MKKLLALLLVLLLSGCGAASEPPSVPEPPAPPQETPLAPQVPTPAPTVPEMIRYHVEMTQREDETCAEDGTVLVSYALTLPTIVPVHEDGTPITEAATEAEEHALYVSETFNQEFMSWTDDSAFDWADEAAEEDYAWRQEEGIPWHEGYTLDLDCTAYQTERLVSIGACYYSYTGGAHPNVSYLGWSFDLETGEFLDVKILGDEEFSTAVTEEFIRQATVWAEEELQLPLEELYWEDYATIMADWSNYAVVFDADGMTVTFSAYALAPYAAGPQVFRVSYDWMESYLNQQGKDMLGLSST